MKSILLGLTLLSTSAFANVTLEDLSELAHKPRRGKACRGVDVTKEQKQSIRSRVREARVQIKSLRPAVKAARKNLRQVLGEASTTREEAIAARKELRQARQPIRKLRRDARLDVQFEILSGEQRVKLLKCRKKQQRKAAGRKARRGQGRQLTGL